MKQDTTNMTVKFTVSFEGDYCQYCPQLSKDKRTREYYCELFCHNLIERLDNDLMEIVRCIPCRKNIKRR